MTVEDRYRIRASERLPLATVAVGLLLYGVGFAVLAARGFAPAAVVAGGLGWFLVPLGVYLDAEALSAEHVLWSPGFVNIAVAAVPFVGAVGGVAFLARRLRLALDGERSFQ